VTWPTRMCDMTHSYVWHDPLICVTRPTHMCDMTHSYVWHDPFICVTRPVHMCDTTHSYVWHDPLICVTWPTHMCDMTHSHVWHDTLICVTWHPHKRDTTRSRMTATTNRFSNISTIQPETSHQWNVKSLLLFTPPHGVYFYNDELNPQLQNLNKDTNSPRFPAYALSTHFLVSVSFIATHCNTLQHTAIHCNTLQHTATHFNALSRVFLVHWVSLAPWSPLSID